MAEKYLVRIIKSELKNFKNIDFGEIKYMNYSSVEKSACIGENDIVGIYGQNGSGKTAMVEALDILKCILSGEEISYDIYEGLLSKESNTVIRTFFFIEHDDKKYKVKYEVHLQVNSNEKKIILYSEKLSYWIRGASWKGERDLAFSNPYYDAYSIINNREIKIESNRKSYFEKVGFIKILQNLAVYCAQKNVSIFFNDLVMKTFSDAVKENTEENAEEVILSDIVKGLFEFGRLYFQVVKVSQLGAINNHIIPLYVHSEKENVIIQGCLPLVMNGHGEISEKVYRQLKSAMGAINIAIKAIVPNLNIELIPCSEEIKQDGTKMIQLDVYSNRNGKRFLTKFESEGIKRIISLLNYLISLYNYPEICLVVDELDSGIFEYLLGELLGVLKEEAKGQLIFTSHNLRAFEKLDAKNIICSTVNSENRYIRLTGVEKNNNGRDFYIRTIVLGGQKEELYDESELQSIGYAFRRAGNEEKKVQIHFSDKFREKLDNS